MSVRFTSTTQQLSSGTLGELFQANQPNTHCVWIKKSVFVGETRKSLVGCYNPANGTAFQFGISNATNFAIWRWGGASLVAFPNADIPVNEWNFFVYRWDGINSQFWLNNLLKGTTTEAPQTGIINEIFVNGYPTGGASETNNDYEIIDYRFYNRALSEAEITSIYNLRGQDHIVFGLIGRWLFNAGAPSTVLTNAVDISFNANNLTAISTNPSYGENNLSYVVHTGQ